MQQFLPQDARETRCKAGAAHGRQGVQQVKTGSDALVESIHS